jgi:hypothetical protein
MQQASESPVQTASGSLLTGARKAAQVKNQQMQPSDTKTCCAEGRPDESNSVRSGSSSDWVKPSYSCLPAAKDAVTIQKKRVHGLRPRDQRSEWVHISNMDCSAK